MQDDDNASIATKLPSAGDEVTTAPTDRRLLPGSEVATVSITIDHAIIQHFSQHLYSSPHKAIEELVVNGYDASASEVRVYLQGEFTKDGVLVWDDGRSMDRAALHRLWWVARSPKNAPGARTVGDRDIIGKFGIGKLATYALGTRVSHLAHVGNEYLLVEFDFSSLGLPDDASPLPDEPKTQELSTPMQLLSEDDARLWLEAQFVDETLPEPAKLLFEAEHWTVALVSGLRELPSPIKSGVLRRVLGNGLPNRPNFSMYVNDSAATQVLTSKQPKVVLTSASPELNAQVKSDWAKLVSDGGAQGEVGIVGAGEALDVPGLGSVRVEVRVFQDSLLTESSAEHGRSYGVFVMVRGRLLNEEDYQHLIHEPSFGTLYRSQITIWADGLDAALLADRERLAASRQETIALRIVEQACYRIARKAAERLQDDAKADELVTTILPTNLRELWHDPIAGYLAAHRQDGQYPDPTSDSFVVRATPGADLPLASYNSTEASFEVNTSHPLREGLDRQFGGGKRATKIRRILDMYAVTEVLLEGHLVDRGYSSEQAAQVVGWRDDLFREVARRFERGPDELQAAAIEMSFQGDKAFELALRDLFIDMGFEARQVGGRVQPVIATA